MRSILFQRGIYPPESFKAEKKYAVTLMVTKDEKLTAYVTAVLQQLSGVHINVSTSARLRQNPPPAPSICQLSLPLLRLAGYIYAAKAGAGRHRHRHEGGPGTLDL